MKKHPLLILALSLFILASCTNYGKSVKHDFVSVYYKDNISESEAQRTADLFYSIAAPGNPEKKEKSLQLLKINDTVCFRMVVDKEKIKGMGDMTFNVIGSMFSDSVFNHAPVKMELTDEYFKTIHAVKFERIDLSGAPQDVDTTAPADALPERKPIRTDQ